MPHGFCWIRVLQTPLKPRQPGKQGPTGSELVWMAAARFLLKSAALIPTLVQISSVFHQRDDSSLRPVGNTRPAATHVKVTRAKTQLCSDSCRWNKRQSSKQRYQAQEQTPGSLA